MVVEVMIDTMRLNDNILHSKTKVNERLAALQDNNDFQGLIWGDAIYPNRGHTVKTSGNEDVDKAMRGCRNSIEHIFGKKDALFPLQKDRSKNKLFARDAKVVEIYFNSMLLVNLHTILYGSVVCSFFKSAEFGPKLHEYMRYPEQGEDDPLADLFAV
jgi:hypothetical protein